MTDFECANTKIYALNNLIDPALTGIVVSAYSDNDDKVTFIAYRQRTLELATFLKLSSIFRVNNPLDCCVVDHIEDKYRFTITYTLQSFGQNNLICISTKTNDLLPLVSLQSLYPSFNWA